MSEDLNHDVPMVKTFIKRILEYVKQEFPLIQYVEFFSDGCGGQYKNSEMFHFLYQCEQLFNFLITWNFFTSAHGKSACDGLGAIIKRQAALESLRRIRNNYILTLVELLKFCAEHIPNIFCVQVHIEEIEEIRKNYNKITKTVPGTRSFHQIKPYNKNIIKCKFSSTD